MTPDVDALSSAKLQSMIVKARMNSVKPNIVNSRSEARAMTIADPLGYKWKVGEEYYMFQTFKRTIPVRVGT